MCIRVLEEIKRATEHPGGWGQGGGAERVRGAGKGLERAGLTRSWVAICA